MAVCKVQDKEIHCPGGCGLICTHDGKQCWGGCSSVLKTRPLPEHKTKDEIVKALHSSEKIHFQCKGMKFSNVAKLLAEVLPHSVTVPEGEEETLIEKEFLGKMDDLIRELRLKKA